MWVTNGPANNPTTGQVLADTGALPLSTISITILVFTDTAFTMNLVQRNALNTADVNVQPLAISTGSFVLIAVPIVLLLNQRVRLTVDTGFTGNVQASILGA